MATIKQRIDNVTENVTDGKQDIASAITEKGVDTNSNATFATMTNNIRAIETGEKDRIYDSNKKISVIAKESGVTIGHSGNTIGGAYAVAEGYATKANGAKSHAEGDTSQANGENSHAEGTGAIASGMSSHAEGSTTKAYGSYSHAEGAFTEASDECSHAEGYQSKATGMYSHAEGYQSRATGNYSHAEGGYQTEANGMCSHAEGYETHAEGANSHSEGRLTQANGDNSHAGGENTIARGNASFTHGIGTKSYNDYEFSCGRYNASHMGTTGDSASTLFSVGFGTADYYQINAIEISQTGVLKCNQAWTTGSDRKLKENIKSLEDNTLEKVLQLNPVSFTLKSDKDKKERIGFIAQEVEELFPQYVTVSIGDDNEETRYLDYSQMVSVLCKAIQEQQQEIKELKRLININ